jgi:primosomal protein N' (replication factor Y)
VERGGTERVIEWAGGFAPTPAVLAQDGAVPAPDRLTVGTAAAVKDAGPLQLDLVAILDADRALLRAGLHAAEQALATWMEAAAWARPRHDGGRVLVQTRRPAHPAIQALIRWEPLPFLLSEGARRFEAGFPPGHAVFRVFGPEGLGESLERAGAGTVLGTALEDGTVCLVAVAPERLARFRNEVIRMAAKGAVARVEAEPHV